MDTGNLNSTQDLAIVAITRRGVELGRRLNKLLPGSFLYILNKFADKSCPKELRFTSTKNQIASIFHLYRYLVLIMAAGIATRMIADELRNKHSDPGVVVIDDAATFCISLLSGHIGGANKLAVKIATLIGAQPVITTASDVNKTISLDILGREFGWQIDDNTRLKDTSASLINGESFGVFQEAGEPGWWSEVGQLPDNITICPSLRNLQQSRPRAAIVITDRILHQNSCKLLPRNTIVYHPRSLVIGIGCNRGTDSNTIENAVSHAFSKYGLLGNCLRTVATVDLKKDEEGILDFAGKHGLAVEYHNKEALCKTRFPSQPSRAAIKHVGTPSVCEAAALLSSHASTLLVPKTSYCRSVTVAVARQNFSGIIQQKAGRLYLVGTGPGDPQHLTFAARTAIEDSDVVIGYMTYVDLIKPLLLRKRIIATGMGSEIERVIEAINLAKQGHTVSLISGGDSGIYGIASLAAEYLSEHHNKNIPVNVIPGVPALAACAALLGSPISGDFVSLSLSDYLVPWDEICNRLEMAAQSNFIIVLYNPQSKHRRRQLVRARQIILQYRSPLTPVGIVTNAYRTGQVANITDLAHLLDGEINMNSTIIIGNRDTFVSDGMMITRRGYHTKYGSPKGIS